MTVHFLHPHNPVATLNFYNWYIWSFGIFKTQSVSNQFTQGELKETFIFKSPEEPQNNYREAVSVRKCEKCIQDLL
jgi:hypothetical protein